MKKKTGSAQQPPEIPGYEYFLYHVNVDVNLPNNSVMLIYAFDNILNKIRKPMFNQHLLRYHEFCNSNMNTYISYICLFL